MRINPFAGSGGHTAFHNSILDYIMPRCTSNEWKVVCITLRKTIGWQKEEDWISLSQYQKLAGIKSRPTAHKAIQGCLSKGFITRSPYKDSFKYALNRNYGIEIDTGSKNKLGVKSKPVASLESEHTIETITIETTKAEALLPATEYQLLFFKKWNANREAQNRKLSKRFPTLEVKEKFEKAEKRLGKKMPNAIQAAFTIGVRSLANYVNYIAKFNPAGYIKPARQSTEDRVSELMEQVGDGDN